jgi:ADP-ribose pyrophosphatase YjhB (NUDIX family)
MGLIPAGKNLTFSRQLKMTAIERPKFWISVNLVLLKDSQVLLLRRQNTGFADGQYNLPAGGLEENESVTDGMIREASEEIGIMLFAEHLKVASILQVPGSRYGGVAFYFTASYYEGEISNREPDKCAEVAFFNIHDLPENLLFTTKIALANIQRGIAFQELPLPDCRQYSKANR